MKKNLASPKPADDLRPHYDVDYSMSRPNPYAGKVIWTHGGQRKSAGRKRGPEPVERHSITLFKSHAKYLRGVNRNLSLAIRQLIAKQKG